MVGRYRCVLLKKRLYILVRYPLKKKIRNRVYFCQVFMDQNYKKSQKTIDKTFDKPM